MLGGGLYGKVFYAYTGMGQSCAVKVYRSRHAKPEAAYEAAIYQDLDKLPPHHRNGFSQMLNFDPSGQPWPWPSLAFAGSSLASWLGTNGPMPLVLMQPVVKQLQAAIRALHRQVQLLHLDVKPANILRC